MKHNFPHLFQPITVRGVTVRNRIVSTAHDTNMAVDHLPSQAHVDYHEARARGGVGLIVMEANSVHPTAEIHGSCIHAYLPEAVEGFRMVSERVHAHGAKMIVQLAHQGVHVNFHKNLTPAWGVSEVPSVWEREIPHVMSRAEIAELIAFYGKSVANVMAGGMDGVEISAGHSYLPAQFLSPWYNRRTDEYGGNLANRMRFLVEVLQVARPIIGDQRLLGVRLSGEELTDFGMKVEDTIEIARSIEKLGLVDYLSISTGSMHTRHLIVPTMALQPGYQLPTTVQVKREVSLPIIGVGRVIRPEIAEETIAAGIADLVGMTRALIADPNLAREAEQGVAEEIRPCIGVNQACRERFFLGKSISCTVNPHAGRERKLAPPPTSARKTVLVAGGGPSGLQAAIVLASRGHEVSLHEASGSLGGQVRMAGLLPGRGPIASLTEHLELLARRKGVRINLESRVDAAMVQASGADVVIVASGSKPRAFPFPEYLGARAIAVGEARVRTLWDAVNGQVEGKRVLVVDEIGRYEGAGAAELLAELGHQVTMCTSMPVVASRLQVTGDYPLIMARLLKKGAVLHPLHLLEDVKAGAAVLAHVHARDQKLRLHGIDEIVFVCGNHPDDGLYQELVRERGDFDLHLIGDANAPRGLDEAIYEAEVVAQRVGVN
jgi:2,4-dienoyl-CoA reductase (NADPH2)